ncbi:MAG: pyridoxal phosphate-dependent aminotransferase [Acidobacteria bacterium]|nr:MAG: pyridoxal phosphate-dependent aminotransferase [Acidobacteriota bacterium]
MFSRRTAWPLAPNSLSQELELRREKGLPIFDLTESNPTRCGFDYAAKTILDALANPGSLAYEPDPHGLLAARQAVASYYAERGVIVPPNQMFLTTSTSEAYSFAFRLLADPGDNVLVPAPSYPLFEYLATLNDLELVNYPLEYDGGWRIRPEAVEALVNGKTRAILVVHPNNPTGSFVKKVENDALVRVSNARGIAIIADEVFSDYSLASETRPDIRKEEPRVVSHASNSGALTLTLSGLSKISALPQMKLAWLVVSGPERERRQAVERLEIIADTYLSVATPLAFALPRLLETRRGIEPQILERVRSNLGWLDGQLAANSLVGRLETEGGWYVVLKLPTIRSDEEWAVEFVRREGVLAHPGHFYDFATEGHIVISLLPPPRILEPAMIRLLEFVKGFV